MKFLISLDPFLMSWCHQEGWKMKRTIPSKLLWILKSSKRNITSDKGDISRQVKYSNFLPLISYSPPSPQLLLPWLWWFWESSWCSTSYHSTWRWTPALVSSWSSSWSSSSPSSLPSGSSGGFAATNTFLLHTSRSRMLMKPMRKRLKSSWRRHYWHRSWN